VWELLGDGALLEQRLGLDLEEFELNQFMIFGQSSQAREVLSSFGLATVVYEPTRREGHECHAAEENEAGCDLEADWNEPSCV
jgi:hypothetical protein